jgi:FkbM family methyltransferase
MAFLGWLFIRHLFAPLLPPDQMADIRALIVAKATEAFGSNWTKLGLKLPVRKGDVVLDLGAHIGAASKLFLDKGAARTIAVEANPVNLPILRKNLARRPVTIIPAAVGPKNGRTSFYVRADRGFVGSTLADPARKKITVPMVSLADLLKRFRPTVVKCDIEFGEYDLPELRALPSSVRVVALEVHIRYDGSFGIFRSHGHRGIVWEGKIGRGENRRLGILNIHVFYLRQVTYRARNGHIAFVFNGSCFRTNVDAQEGVFGIGPEWNK